MAMNISNRGEFSKNSLERPRISFLRLPVCRQQQHHHHHRHLLSMGWDTSPREDDSVDSAPNLSNSRRTCRGDTSHDRKNLLNTDQGGVA